MIDYDSSVIQSMVDGLYAQARRIEVIYTLVGGLLCAAGGCFLAEAIERDLAIVGLVVGALIGAWMGFNSGRSRAFLLRLQAQTALCQVQIERNTRQAARMDSPSAGPARADGPVRPTPNSGGAPSDSAQDDRLSTLAARVPPPKAAKAV